MNHGKDSIFKQGRSYTLEDEAMPYVGWTIGGGEVAKWSLVMVGEEEDLGAGREGRENLLPRLIFYLHY